MTAQPRNRLAGETSPYLLQHAANPVDWYPWGAEALDRARREDKPILLSIGYSACHWCHVMAHESFEDEDTARLMNGSFINIKVDREERPDLDRVYQLAHQLLTQRGGGWPLTMFLSPHNHVPFFGGTYFPRHSRYGLPDFRQVLRRVADYYRDHRADIETQNRLVVEALERLGPQPPAGPVTLDSRPLDLSRNELARLYDAGHGGFGGAPKFPHPPHIAFLIRHWAATALMGRADGEALDMALTTLRSMAASGLYDQLGGGFFRYCVDAAWEIPHFEKMLYDNAQLLPVYCEAWRITGDDRYARAARETAEWALRDMRAPGGAFYASLDADAEGGEGAYYVWTPEEVQGLLDAEHYDAAARHYGLDRAANFEGHAWHLRVAADAAAVAAGLGGDRGRVVQVLEEARTVLLQARTRRPAPGRDDKVLTAWNGLMIKGLAMAGRCLDEPRFTAAAQEAAGFIHAALWRDGRLCAVHAGGAARHAAYLDDYAFLADGLLELFQTRTRPELLHFAVDLAEVMLAHFHDREAGGFYFTADDHEALIQRPKPAGDDALPSGNGTAALVLLRLGHMLAQPRYLEAAERAVTALWPTILQLPYAHNTLLAAVDEVLHPPQTVVLRGDAAEAAPWLARLHGRYAPRRRVLVLPPDARGLPGQLDACAARGPVTAYVCQGVTCSPPITRLEELEAAVAPGEVGAAAGAGP